ncbi:MAG: regulatory protein RecX, partial [Phascolarctobacterium sp.]
MMWNRSSRKSSKKLSSENQSDDNRSYEGSRSHKDRSPKVEGFASAQEAYDCALNLLSYRDFSKQRMQERLQRKGADAAQAEAAVAKLEDYNLINDERYARRVYEGWLNKRCYGRQHLAAELAKRGLGPELSQEILARFTPELEEEHAANAAALFVQRNHERIAEAQSPELTPQERMELQKKLYGAAGRFLASR